MDKQQQLIQIRTRKLGLLMADARQAQRRDVEETASAIGLTPVEIQAYESGQKAPPLPVLENLAYYLDVPIDHFWGNSSINQPVQEQPIAQKERLRRLRDRVIGATLRMHRTRLNFSPSEVTSATTISEEQLEKFELGAESIPLPLLELLAKTYDVRIEDFFDTKGPVGQWREKKNAQQQFQELPENLRDFVCQPVNQPYLNLAMRLSQLSVEKLRGVAEGLLEITY